MAENRMVIDEDVERAQQQELDYTGDAWGVKELTIDDILAVFPNTRDAKTAKEIKEQVMTSIGLDVSLFSPDVEAIVSRQVDKLLRADKRLGVDSYLSFKGRKYKKRKNKRPIIDTDSQYILPANTAYTGRAGECAVMSELLFRGYNANHMMVDDGVDVIAAKDNIYYYIQVKTAKVKDGRIYCKIGLDSFDRYIKSQMRYIIVARYQDKATGFDHNLFFTFTSAEIDQYVYEKYIMKGESGYNIKIRFSERDGSPILYDEKEREISWHLNRFNL